MLFTKIDNVRFAYFSHVIDFKRNDGLDCSSPIRIRVADHGGFLHSRIRVEHIFDLHGGDKIQTE
ncbi:MAG: hypothetical protein R6X10_05300 [Desulfobacterales bacterium]